MRHTTCCGLQESAQLYTTLVYYRQHFHPVCVLLSPACRWVSASRMDTSVERRFNMASK